jgi:hypothetical protein
MTRVIKSAESHSQAGLRGRDADKQPLVGCTQLKPVSVHTVLLPACDCGWTSHNIQRHDNTTLLAHGARTPQSVRNSGNNDTNGRYK